MRSISVLFIQAERHPDLYNIGNRWDVFLLHLSLQPAKGPFTVSVSEVSAMLLVRSLRLIAYRFLNTRSQSLKNWLRSQN